MRRESRMKRKTHNNFIYIAGGFLFLLIVTFVILYVVYNRKLNEISESFTSEKIIGLVPNTEDNTEDDLASASSIISKTMKEAIENQKEDTEQERTENENASIENVNNENEIETVTQEKEASKEEIKKELSFEYPVEGEITKDFSMDTLVFSETLQEWTVHQGIDIKAARTTVVKAAEEGIITAIKNDPRYGVTIIIEHSDGYKTIYSNLLSTEFVTEGEKVTKGQSIGTVGNSAVFEIADEPHLHFEIIKDGIYQDPKLLLK